MLTPEPGWTAIVADRPRVRHGGRWYTREVTGRIVIVDSRPCTPTGRYPAKAVIGQPTTVSADIFRDGHDLLAARVGWRPEGESKWRYAPMTELGNDRWTATVEPTALGRHESAHRGVDRPLRHLAARRPVKQGAGQDITVELEEGALLLERRAADAADGPTPARRAGGPSRRLAAPCARPGIEDGLALDALQPHLAASRTVP